MAIDDEAAGPAQGPEAGPESRRDGESAAVGGVDVQPQAPGVADVGDLVQGVDGPRGRGAGARHDGDDMGALGVDGVEHADEVVGSHAEAIVAGDGADGASSQAHDLGGPPGRVVGLIAGDEDEGIAQPLLPHVMGGGGLTGGEQSREVPRAASVGEDAVGRGRIEADEPGHPADEGLLHGR